jgi:hypothetical protein
MKTIIISLTAFLFSFTIYSQPNDIMINPYWYFYSNNHLDAVSSGMGSTGIGTFGSISTVSLNPASMEIEGKYQANIQYTYKSNQTWLPQFGNDDLYLKHNIFSGSVGFGYRINKNFQFGFIYSNPRSMTFNIGEIVQTNEFGEEIGRYDASDKLIQHSFEVPVVFSSDKFRLGISLGYVLNRRYYDFGSGNSVAKLDKFKIHGGVIVLPVKELAIGVAFNSGYSGDVDHINNNGINVQTEKATIPMEFGAGASYTLKNNLLKFACDYKYVNGSKLDGQKDQHSIHFGLEYNVDKQWKVRTGFFTQSDPRDLATNYVNPQDSYDQIFLTVGSSLKIQNALISIAIMDSHISSGTLKYTFINGGLNLNF